VLDEQQGRSRYRKIDDPFLLSCIRMVFEKYSIHGMTVPAIREKMREFLPPDMTVPSVSTVTRILQGPFRLHYRPSNPASTKYNDSTYLSKRLWVGRLLAQFLFDDALILSIDESNIRSDKLGGRAWMLNPRLIKKKREMSQRMFKRMFQRKATLFNTDARVLNIHD
jgi:hypothetical protein